MVEVSCYPSLEKFQVIGGGEYRHRKAVKELVRKTNERTDIFVDSWERNLDRIAMNVS